MGLRQDILNEPVSELDLRELITAKPTETVRQAVARMREKKLGCVVIVDEDGRPMGKFTERLLIKLLLTGESKLDEPVSLYMAAVWGTIKLTDPIATAIRVMEEKSLRFLIVLDDQGRAVRLAGQRGLMEYIVEHFPRAVKGQTMDSKLYMDQREGA